MTAQPPPPPPPPHAFRDLLLDLLGRTRLGDQRPGQWAFNVLAAARPELADAVRGTDVDPFHRDDRLPELLAWVRDRRDDDPPDPPDPPPTPAVAATSLLLTGRDGAPRALHLELRLAPDVDVPAAQRRLLEVVEELNDAALGARERLKEAP